MAPSLDQIREFAEERFGGVTDVGVLQAGAWSSAYSFHANGRELVLRVGRHQEDFDKELAATTWCVPGLPVPEVFELGEAFGSHYIVSQRHSGTKLADLEPSRVTAAIEALFNVLAAMRHVSLSGEGYGIWLAPGCDAPSATWADYLCAVAERDENRLVDWRRKLALHSQANAAFHQGCETLQAHAELLPTTRGLVHADLLLNHLVGPDNSITAVFDWGNALAGDPLYDIAWTVFCIPWTPTIDRDHVLRLTRQHFPDDDLNTLLPLYELHVALDSLQYMAYVDDLPGMQYTAGRAIDLRAMVQARSSLGP